MVGACPTADTDALSRTLTALATLLLVGTPSGASKGESGMVGLAKDLGLPVGDGCLVLTHTSRQFAMSTERAMITHLKPTPNPTN